QLAHQEVESSDALAWSHGPLRIGGSAKGHGADLISLSECDVCKQHHGVQHVVEKRASDAIVALVRAHAPPGVDQEHDTLVALVLELTNDGFAGPQGR